MNFIDKIHLSDYHYALPEERIAYFPAEPRDYSKLLHYQQGEIKDFHFYDLPSLLPQGSLLIFNNTRVIPARIIGYRPSGGAIEVFLLEPYEQNYEQVWNETSKTQWKCMVKNLRKWKENEVLHLPLEGEEVRIQWVHRGTTNLMVSIEWQSGKRFAEILMLIGKIPLPPYMKRAVEHLDYEAYQTAYAKHQGAVAAPTAGLHFTPELLQALPKYGIQTAEVTLHVGAGTFKPIETNNLYEHIMHQEYFTVSLETLKLLVEHEGPVVAVGTTSVRTLESLYWFAYLDENTCFLPQFFPYETEAKYTWKESLQILIERLEKTEKQVFKGYTSLFIMPGYVFRSVQGLITNFHQPGSTLLLLIGAWVGKHWRKIYEHALNHDYRFLSYGDSSLLWH